MKIAFGAPSSVHRAATTHPLWRCRDEKQALCAEKDAENAPKCQPDSTVKDSSFWLSALNILHHVDHVNYSAFIWFLHQFHIQMHTHVKRVLHQNYILSFNM